MARDKVLWNDISMTAKQQFVSLLTIAEVEETILRFQQLVNDGETELGCVPCKKAGSGDGYFYCEVCAYGIIARDLGYNETNTTCCDIHTTSSTHRKMWGSLSLGCAGGRIHEATLGIRAAKTFCRAVIKHWQELLAIRKGMSKNDLAKHKRAAKRTVKGK